MRTTPYLLILLLSISLVSASLSDYPKPFVNNHYADNLALVVSESEVTLYSIVSADIASGLAPVKGNTKTLLDKELLTGYQNYDLILIGSPCNNKLTAKFLTDCKFNPGEARIKLVDNGNNKALIVMGYNFDALRNAGIVLRNYKDYNLIGNDIIIRKLGSDIVISETSTGKTVSSITTPTPTIKPIIQEGCIGCLVDKTCINNDIRIFDEYCQNSILYKQKEIEQSCNYNYECISNKCDNTCQKPTSLEYLLNLLKSLFQNLK